MNLIQRVAHKLGGAFATGGFKNSIEYWEHRYRVGGNSGSGSYGRLAEFKAEIINDFVTKHGITSVVELGCGDGNQLALSKYPVYFGLDVSATAVARCSQMFAADQSKKFIIHRNGSVVPQADLALSLDVIYHLVEDRIFEQYMRDLFGAATRYVIIYSSDQTGDQRHHEKMRNFTLWVREKVKSFRLAEVIKNPYPYDATDPERTSQSDFFIYERLE